jgi:hypothetical protein
MQPISLSGGLVQPSPNVVDILIECALRSRSLFVRGANVTDDAPGVVASDILWSTANTS